MKPTSDEAKGVGPEDEPIQATHLHRLRYTFGLPSRSLRAYSDPDSHFRSL
jgi:hypothetical protein